MVLHLKVRQAMADWTVSSQKWTVIFGFTYTLNHAVACKQLHVESVLLWTPNCMIVIVTKLPVNLLY